MTTNIVPLHPPRGMDVHDREQLDLLKRTLCPVKQDGTPDITDDEFALFIRVADHTALDPFRRQIYAVKRQGKLTIQTGIDGYRAIANRTGVYAGQDDVVFTGQSKNKQYPGTATVTVYKVVAGLRVPFTASARWEEFYPGDGGVGTMWRKMPHNQLGKCAEALALRKAFPEELAGVYVEDEMMRPDIEDRTIRPEEPPKSRAEIIRDRYKALPVNDKIAFTAWRKAEGLEGDEEEVLDRVEAKLNEVEQPGAQAPAPPASGDLPACSICGSSRTARTVVDGVVRCQLVKDCATRAEKRRAEEEVADAEVVEPDEAEEEGLLCVACMKVIEGLEALDVDPEAPMHRDCYDSRPM